MWPQGPPEKEKKRMCDTLKAVVSLRSHGLHGASVIGAYHARRVTSLMAHALQLYGMTPSTQLDGMVLAQGPLHDSEVAQRIKQATGEANDVFPISMHPVMWPDTGFYRATSRVSLPRLYRSTARAHGCEGGEPCHG